MTRDVWYTDADRVAYGTKVCNGGFCNFTALLTDADRERIAVLYTTLGENEFQLDGIGWSRREVRGDYFAWPYIDGEPPCKDCYPEEYRAAMATQQGTT